MPVEVAFSDSKEYFRTIKNTIPNSREAMDPEPIKKSVAAATMIDKIKGCGYIG